jgi:glycosyltransferase involved in cell wall biosynthesis
MELLTRLATAGPEFVLYSHQPFNTTRFEVKSVRCRTANLQRTYLASPFAQWRYPHWIREDRIDVFWSPRHHLPLSSPVPGVVTIHDLVWRKAPDSMIALGRTLERVLMPPSLKKAAAIIAVSEATKNDLIEYMPATAEKISVIHESSFVHQGTIPAPTRSKTLLFVGTYEPRKNIPGILRAFAHLIRDGITDYQLILAGNPGWKQDVDGLIDNLGLADHVRQIRPGSDNELASLYAACDFTVQPAFYEGFGLPILEAMSFGKPVITSNVSSMPEIAGNAALLVNPNSVAEIAGAMRQLITDPGLYETLAERARLQSAKFSWDRAATQTLNVLEAVYKATSRN